jgi:hypothetical protein
MTVDPAVAGQVAEHNGRRYYFAARAAEPPS